MHHKHPHLQGMSLKNQTLKSLVYTFELPGGPKPAEQLSFIFVLLCRFWFSLTVLEPYPLY
jgi:hypothetical protein